MKLTKLLLQRAIEIGLSKIDLDNDEVARIIRTVKTGSEAQYHTGSACEGYFCIEDSILSGCYYDMPSIYHQLIENVNTEVEKVDPYLYVDVINSVEFAVYK